MVGFWQTSRHARDGHIIEKVREELPCNMGLMPIRFEDPWIPTRLRHASECASQLSCPSGDLIMHILPRGSFRCVRGWFWKRVNWNRGRAQFQTAVPPRAREESPSPPLRALHIGGILQAGNDAFHAGDTFPIPWGKEALGHVGPGVCVPPGICLDVYPCVSSVSWPLTLLQS